MPDIGFVNGQFMPLEDARVPVEDRAFQFADGVYEVIRTYRGMPYQVEAHLARLERSARAIELPLPFRAQEWKDFIAEGLKRAAFPESKIYLQITRGVAPRDHVFPMGAPPTAVMTVREMHGIDSTLRAGGVSAVTMPDLRWGRCDIKSVNLLPNVMALQRARTGGAFEVVFIRDGAVTEGSVSNVVMVSGDTLVTPPEGERILSGVTRAVVVGLARKEGISVAERAITLEEFRRADEIFLTGTTFEVLPVVRLDGNAVGSGTPGVLTTRMIASFERSHGA